MKKDQELKLKRQLMALGKAKRFAEAENLARHMLSQLPGDMELWYAYAQIEMALDKQRDSAIAYLKAAEKPSSVRLHTLQMATDMCQEAGLYDLGYQAARHLLSLAKPSAESLFKAGYFAWHCQKDKEALDLMQQAVKASPNNAVYWEQLAQVYVHLGQIREALHSLEQVVSLDPSKLSARILWLYISNYLIDLSESSLFDAHVDFARHVEGLYPERKLAPPDRAGRRIRVGYLSRDFRSHAVASFFLPLVAAHDRRKVEVFCYADVAKPDGISEKIRALSEHWVNVVDMNDRQLSERIRQDGVDVLVDLAGYAGGSRVPVFAMRSAPVQMSYLGYPNTSGLKSMDYRITDVLCDPIEENGRFYTESLVRQSQGFLCYRCLDEELPETDAPCADNGYVTFGSFNVYPKIQAPVREAWARILSQVPGARLLIKAKPFSEPSWRDSVSRFFIDRGVAKEQLLFLGRSASYQEHLEAYGQIDIHLDTHPYNGTTTTCDALWMGVPTLCLAGDSHRARVSASIMKRVGLNELVAESLDDYIDKAVAFARQPESVISLRKGNRARMEGSTLTSGPAIAGELESFYETVLKGNDEPQ